MQDFGQAESDILFSILKRRQLTETLPMRYTAGGYPFLSELHK
jgi:hypothetical protein